MNIPKIKPCSCGCLEMIYKLESPDSPHYSRFYCAGCSTWLAFVSKELGQFLDKLTIIREEDDE